MSDVAAIVVQDIKFPMSLDVFDLCTPELQQQLTPARDRFKAEEDKRVEVAQTVKVCLVREIPVKLKKVNDSHTRKRALGQELIPHPPSSRLPLLSAGPAVTFPAAEHHRPLAGTKLYFLVTEAHRCEKLAHSFDAAFVSTRI